MLTLLAGNGRLTRKPELRTTSSGATVTTVAIASSRRGSDEDPIYVDLILWEAGGVRRRAPRQGPGGDVRRPPRAAGLDDREGNARVAIEVHGVDLEYGVKPRAAAEDTIPA